MADRTSILTEREKEVLRHVHALKTSAQIAHDLRIAEVSVNKRIDSARRKLGGISRRQAAVLLASEEQAGGAGSGSGEAMGYDNLIPSGIVLTDHTEDRPDAARDTPVSGSGAMPEAASVPVQGGRRNVYDIWQRLGIIFLSMAVLTALASVYIALLRSR